MTRLTGVCFASVLFLLAGCAGNYAPVIDYYGDGRSDSRAQRPAGSVSIPADGTHQVRQGDTLYGIAWRYGLDYRRLAAANNIGPPYVIYPGQQLSLDVSKTAAPSAATSGSSSTSASRSTQSSPSAPSTSTPSRPSSSATPPAATGWRWPADGEVISGFSPNGRQGIAIAGDQGDPVRAAESGVVVYRGDGLTGYGNLLIIKHDDRWLSAYGYNANMRVREGERVSGGQHIADMGATGTSRVQLHFEIRRDGKPVDPRGHLPKR